MTYWQLFSILKRWFMSRWWDILCDDQWLMDYINLAIQDIYNEDNSTWRHQTETLVWTLNWDHYKYETTFPIHKIQEAYQYNSNWQISYIKDYKLTPTLKSIKKCKDIKFAWKEIISHKEVNKIEVTYLMDYVPAAINEKNKPLPFPYRYVPVVLKFAMDWAAPINLMSSESSTVDFYTHWITRNNKIRDNDSLTDYLEIESAF